MTIPHQRPVTFDFMADDAYFALTDALREFASRQRWEAADDPTGNASSRVQWAEAAEGLLDRIEDAFSVKPSPEHPKVATSAEDADVQMVTVPRADLRLAMSALRDLAAHGSPQNEAWPPLSAPRTRSCSARCSAQSRTRCCRPADSSPPCSWSIERPWCSAQGSAPPVARCCRCRLAVPCRGDGSLARGGPADHAGISHRG
jgi:hypothetical protein